MIYLLVEGRLDLRGVCLNISSCVHILFSVFSLLHSEISFLVNMYLIF
jgi:hypothetical protein